MASPTLSNLAAFQVPFVRADPVQGMKVNAVGTTIVFNAFQTPP